MCSLLLGVLIHTLVKLGRINVLTILYQLEKQPYCVITLPQHQEQLGKTDHRDTRTSWSPSSTPWKNIWELSGGDLALESPPQNILPSSREKGVKSTQAQT